MNYTILYLSRTDFEDGALAKIRFIFSLIQAAKHKSQVVLDPLVFIIDEYKVMARSNIFRYNRLIW